MGTRRRSKRGRTGGGNSARGGIGIIGAGLGTGRLFWTDQSSLAGQSCWARKKGRRWDRRGIEEANVII